MKRKELELELEKTYKEVEKWPRQNARLKWIIPKEEIERRENVLLQQKLLFRIEKARKEKDRREEYFNLAFYYLIKSMT